MKIAITARSLSIRCGGVNEVLRSLIPALSRQIGDDEIFVFYNDKEFLGLAPNGSEIYIEGNNRIWWDYILFPQALRKLKPDAVIFPKNLVPFFTGTSSYVVVHDMGQFKPELDAYPFLDNTYMKTLMPSSMRRATRVFAISENTKRDILHYTNCGPEKIVVAYEAAHERYHPIEDCDLLGQVRTRYELPDRFILYTGSLSPRKNVVRLLEAFHRIREKVSHRIVLTASKSWKDSAVYRAMRELAIEDRIHKLGFVEAQDMPALYNLADACVYPSLYEGFGLPVLEAMQSGCPVVASNASSIPEVAGDAAILVDPLDIAALGDAIYRVLTNRELHEKLVSAGFQRAQEFSWDRTAQIMLETIRSYY
jgi:glycosyltransferase involved in cell wall biosynthesis